MGLAVSDSQATSSALGVARKPLKTLRRGRMQGILKSAGDSVWESVPQAAAPSNEAS
jgi:hypothetical protein